MITDIYKKYKAEHYQETSNLTPLSFILRKAEIGENLTDLEWGWLEQQQLIETKGIIKSQEDYRDSLLEELRTEFFQLMRTPFLFNSIKKIPWIAYETALVLYKVNVHERLTNKELQLVDIRYHRFLDFNDRKRNHGITEDIPFDSSAGNILLKLEKKTLLCADDIGGLVSNNANSFLKPLKAQFSQLQNKYKANIQDNSDIDPLLLFYFLQKIEENSLLNQDEVLYLKENGYLETLGIIEEIKFSALKVKYRATQIQENSITHHLYKVLKRLDSGMPLTESDINYLKKRKLYETVKFIYKKEADCLIQKIEQGHGLRPDDVIWCEEHGFEEIILKWLKNEYEVKSYEDKPGTLYTILRKLEKGNRLTDVNVVWLEGENLLRRTNKVYIAHHTLEALYYENEFQRTKGYWNLVNASAHWRKSEKSKQALSLTDNLNFKKIKPAKLRDALLTTRGGAFRDIDDIVEAEKCALEAINHYPDSHNPYTLMGALYYDKRNYVEGDRWFDEAIKRGAKPLDQDLEIKRILRKKLDQKLIDHLLKKDPRRFSWVKDFARRSINRKQQKRA